MLHQSCDQYQPVLPVLHGHQWYCLSRPPRLTQSEKKNYETRCWSQLRCGSNKIPPLHYEFKDCRDQSHSGNWERDTKLAKVWREKVRKWSGRWGLQKTGVNRGETKGKEAAWCQTVGEGHYEVCLPLMTPASVQLLCTLSWGRGWKWSGNVWVSPVLVPKNFRVVDSHPERILSRLLTL